MLVTRDVDAVALQSALRTALLTGGFDTQVGRAGSAGQLGPEPAIEYVRDGSKFMISPYAAQILNASGGAAGEFTHIAASVMTRRSLADIAVHDDEELRRLRWIKIGEHSAALAASATYYLQNTDGSTWSGMLTVKRDVDATKMAPRFVLARGSHLIHDRIKHAMTFHRNVPLRVRSPTHSH